MTRGGQQIQVTVTLTGALFNQLTAGDFFVRVLYVVAA
jgi:hypothetical protein